MTSPQMRRGTIFTFTVNEQQFHPDVPPPYVIAIVELDGEGSERVVGNIVDADNASLRCGQAVSVDVGPDGERAAAVFRVIES